MFNRNFWHCFLNGFSDIKSADQLRQQAASLTIQTSPEVTQEVINTILSNPSLPYYFTLFNNCTDGLRSYIEAAEAYEVARDYATRLFQ